jgi:hypothetical protein
VVREAPLEQAVEVIVNAWNRNIIPWWLLWSLRAIIHVAGIDMLSRASAGSIRGSVRSAMSVEGASASARRTRRAGR